MTAAVKRPRVLTGEADLRPGNFDDARRAFQGVNCTPGLIACGAAALEAGWYHDARSASSARAEKPKEKLVACGHAARQSGWIDEAVSAFLNTGLGMPVDGLIVCGTKALQDGRHEAARQAFGIAPAPRTRAAHVVAGSGLSGVPVTTLQSPTAQLSAVRRLTRDA